MKYHMDVPVEPVDLGEDTKNLKGLADLVVVVGIRNTSLLMMNLKDLKDPADLVVDTGTNTKIDLKDAMDVDTGRNIKMPKINPLKDLALVDVGKGNKNLPKMPKDLLVVVVEAVGTKRNVLKVLKFKR